MGTRIATRKAATFQETKHGRTNQYESRTPRCDTNPHSKHDIMRTSTVTNSMPRYGTNPHPKQGMGTSTGTNGQWRILAMENESYSVLEHILFVRCQCFDIMNTENSMTRRDY